MKVKNYKDVELKTEKAAKGAGEAAAGIGGKP